MIRGSDMMNTVAAFFAVIWLSGCADSTLPQPRAEPGGAPNDVYRMGTVTVTAQCDPYLSLNWCASGGECMTVVAATAEPTTWSSTCGTPTGSGGAGGGGGTGTTTGGTGGTGGALPGDVDGDGDSLDDGPAAFALCVATKLGVGGWAAIGGTAFSAWQLWDAKSATRTAEARYNAYAALRGEEMNLDILNVYFQAWQDAKSAETAMYVAIALSGTVAASELAKATAACSLVAALPTV